MVRLTKNVGCMTITVEGENLMDAFEEMSMSEECFEPCPINGASSDYKLRVRTVEKDNDEFTYYELVSPIFEDGQYKGQARLSLSQYNKPKLGWLYPKRRDKEKKNLPNRGWEVYEKTANSAPAQSEPAKSSTKSTSSSKKAKVEEPDF